MSLSALQIQTFRNKVRLFYRANARAFPWRKTRNPYKILVSELMLQQTQTERVIPKYKLFLKRFPTVRTLAAASLEDVIKMWSGLGYNRRAKFLWQSAKCIVEEHKGILPSEVEQLMCLPGVGEYTANALRAFAFDLPSVCIETNIRTVFLSYFFQGQMNITDRQIQRLILQTLPRKGIREWYYALMDMGVHLKSVNSGINKQSKHYKKQSPFKGSDREVRGAILKMLIAKKTVLLDELTRLFPQKKKQLPVIISALSTEGFLKVNGRKLVFTAT